MNHNIKRLSFKQVFTCNDKSYYVDPSWTVAEFINNIKYKVKRDFNFDNFEIVESGQPTNNNVAEDAPALIINDNTLLRTYFGNNLEVSFYIRPIINLIDLPEVLNRNNNTVISMITGNPSTISNPTSPNNEHGINCAICMVNPRSVLFRPCNHLSTCAVCAYHQSMQRCPICRIIFEERINVYM